MLRRGMAREFQVWVITLGEKKKRQKKNDCSSSRDGEKLEKKKCNAVSHTIPLEAARTIMSSAQGRPFWYFKHSWISQLEISCALNILSHPFLNVGKQGFWWMPCFRYWLAVLPLCQLFLQWSWCTDVIISVRQSEGLVQVLLGILNACTIREFA